MDYTEAGCHESLHGEVQAGSCRGWYEAWFSQLSSYAWFLHAAKVLPALSLFTASCVVSKLRRDWQWGQGQSLLGATSWIAACEGVTGCQRLGSTGIGLKMSNQHLEKGLETANAAAGPVAQQSWIVDLSVHSNHSILHYLLFLSALQGQLHVEHIIIFWCWHYYGRKHCGQDWTIQVWSQLVHQTQLGKDTHPQLRS